MKAYRWKLKILSRSWLVLGRRFLERNSFSYFSCLKAACTDLDSPHASIRESNFHVLKVREKTTACDPRNFLSDAARFFGKPTAGDRTSDNGFFIADFTMTHRPNIIGMTSNLASPFFWYILCSFHKNSGIFEIGGL